MVGAAFDSADEAFARVVDGTGLAGLVEELLPGRYSPEEVQALWRHLSHGGGALTREAFVLALAGVTFRRALIREQQVAKHLARCTSEQPATKLAAFASVGLISDQLRRNLKAKGVALAELFPEGKSNIVEFTNKVKGFGIRP